MEDVAAGRLAESGSGSGGAFREQPFHELILCFILLASSVCLHVCRLLLHFPLCNLLQSQLFHSARPSLRPRPQTAPLPFLPPPPPTLPNRQLSAQARLKLLQSLQALAQDVLQRSSALLAQLALDLQRQLRENILDLRKGRESAEQRIKVKTLWLQFLRLQTLKVSVKLIEAVGSDAEANKVVPLLLRELAHKSVVLLRPLLLKGLDEPIGAIVEEVGGVGPGGELESLPVLARVDGFGDDVRTVLAVKTVKFFEFQNKLKSGPFIHVDFLHFLISPCQAQLSSPSAPKRESRPSRPARPLLPATRTSAFRNSELQRKPGSPRDSNTRNSTLKLNGKPQSLTARPKRREPSSCQRRAEWRQW